MTQKGAPDCGLYIRIPDQFEIQDLIIKLQQIFTVAKRSKYEKNLHVLEFPARIASPDSEDHIKALVEYTQKNGFVAILRNDAVMAQTVNADGVILDDAKDVPSARALIGGERIIGLRCGSDKNLAERGIEQGIDYISLTTSSTLISWWATKSELPAVAQGSISNDDCATFVRAGATFIDSSDYILSHPKGVMQGTVDMLYAIDLALEKRAVN